MAVTEAPEPVAPAASPLAARLPPGPPRKPIYFASAPPNG